MSNAARAIREKNTQFPEGQPPVLEEYSQTGLNQGVLTDLLLKALYVQGMRTGRQLADLVRLPFVFVDDRVLDLQHRRHVEVRGTSGPSRSAYHFELTNAGRERAREALDSSQYIGPAPVPLEQYRIWTLRQSISNTRVSDEAVREGFKALVLQDAMLDMLGPAINSAKSLFLYGAPGNGKTYISETIASLLGGSIFIPHAIEVDGQILTLFDPIYHQEIPDDPGIPQESWLQAPHGYDRRFIRIRRPVVLVGGELTLDQLDMKYDPFAKTYSAPFQMRANGGVLILDDFGRQRIPPRDLLNRWIVPLEKRIDYLALHTGGKFPVPFDTPADLRDQPGADRPGGGGLPPPDPLQDQRARTEPSGLRGDLPPLLRRAGDPVQRDGGALRLRRVVQAPGDRAARLPSARHPRSRDRHLPVPAGGRPPVSRPGGAGLPLVLPRRHPGHDMSATEPRDQAQRVRGEAALSTRMDYLDREYRRLRRLNTILLVGTALVVGLATALIALAGQYGLPGTTADVVAARQFVLRGDNGVVRGMWGTEDDGTLRLVLQDASARARVKINLLNDGSSGLTFSDSTGKPRAVFAALPDQSTSIVLADEAGRGRIVLGLSADGGATLVFADRSGGTRASLGVDRNGNGTYTMTDRVGREPVEAAPPEESQPDTTPTPR